METPEDSSLASSPALLPLPLPPITFPLPVMSKMAADTQDENLEKEEVFTETHAPRVNMATVAPFSYR